MAKKSKSKSRSKSSKRVLNALELAEREVGENYSGSDDDTYPRRKSSNRNGTVVNLLKRMEGGNDDDDNEYESNGDSFEDEELDSDAALGSDDDYDVMDSKMSQTLRDRQKANNGVLPSEDEDEGGYTSIDEEDLMPLSQIWDTNTKGTGGSDAESGEDNMKFQDDMSDSESASDDESSEEESEDDKEENPFDEISEDEDDVNLNTITNNLLKETSKVTSKRLDTYGTGDENEFILPTTQGGAEMGSGKLSLEDMMNIVDDKEVIEKANLIRGDSTAATVPLPQRIQQRHERKAAYEISKDEVNKWNDTVKQNRRAEHLNFAKDTSQNHNHSSAFALNPSKEAQSELQTKVQEVLKESNLVDPQKESKFEELATAKMTPEEMRKRTTEMRLMRELMFREERKSKRIKKIKSKAYHRIKKKEMLKNRELAGVSDESDTEHDVARAKERMTLKHKAHSKWAKDMVKHGMANDAETREEMEEMLRQGERLRSKIIDQNSDDENRNTNLSDLERSDDEEDNQEIVKDKVGKTGVMNMAFMRNAEAREKEANKQEIARIRAAERGEDMDLFDDDNESKSGESVQLNKGRRIYTPGNLEARREMDEVAKKARKEQEIDESSNLVNRLKKINGDNGEEIEIRIENNHKEIEQDEDGDVKSAPSESANPWLNDSDDENTGGNVKRSTKLHVIDKDSSKLSKSSQKIAKEMDKQARKNKASKKRGNDDNDDLLLDTNDSNKLNIIDPYGGSDDEGQSFMFKQQDIIAEAFAGDNVVAEFEEEKKRMIEDEDDKEEDVTLPGWGSWSGAGTNPNRKKRKFVKKVKGIMSKDKRKDKHLQNVIINEKVNKKHLKYQSSGVPFPYENREQYERSLRMPLGPQWTSSASYQQNIKPRILTKPGQVIDPLKQPFK